LTDSVLGYNVSSSYVAVVELISDLFRLGSPEGRGLIDQDNISLKGQFRTGGPYWI
jgi:hypothetical protein